MLLKNTFSYKMSISLHPKQELFLTIHRQNLTSKSYKRLDSSVLIFLISFTRWQPKNNPHLCFHRMSSVWLILRPTKDFRRGERSNPFCTVPPLIQADHSQRRPYRGTAHDTPTKQQFSGQIMVWLSVSNPKGGLRYFEKGTPKLVWPCLNHHTDSTRTEASQNSRNKISADIRVLKIIIETLKESSCEWIHEIARDCRICFGCAKFAQQSLPLTPVIREGSKS